LPYQRLAASVLDKWREVERRLADCPPGSDAAEDLQAEAAALRDEYQRLIAAAIEAHRPVPPPFPDHATAPDPTPSPSNLLARLTETAEPGLS
jgi:hypothetical protein